jgi:hypothetical protein
MTRIAVFTAVACLTLAARASAASPPTLPLASPPVASGQTASTIFDAFMAISRQANANPRAAQTASFTYAAALQQFAAGETERARESAIQAIVQTEGPPLPPALANAPVVSPPAPARMPMLANDIQAEMETRIDLARDALLHCGSTSAAPFTTVRPLYDQATKEQMAGNHAAVTSDVQKIVDACAAAAPVTGASEADRNATQ